jgi:hypothetical protein
MTASVERGGLGPGSLRGAGFLAVCWSSGVSYGPGSGGIGRGGGRDPLSKRVRSLHLWCCSLPCFCTVVLCWAMFVWAWACWPWGPCSVGFSFSPNGALEFVLFCGRLAVSQYNFLFIQRNTTQHNATQ